MQIGSSPRVCSSRRRVVYKASSWRVHQFEIWSGELVCKAVVLRVEGAVLVWLGGRGAPLLSEAALGMSRTLGTTLLGAGEGAGPLARRLAALLACPVYVCAGLQLDRLTLPLVERGLVAEIKSRPECF